jgi:hypothetical protein
MIRGTLAAIQEGTLTTIEVMVAELTEALEEDVGEEVAEEEELVVVAVAVVEDELPC